MFDHLTGLPIIQNATTCTPVVGVGPVDHVPIMSEAVDNRMRVLQVECKRRHSKNCQAPEKIYNGNYGYVNRCPFYDIKCEVHGDRVT